MEPVHHQNKKTRFTCQLPRLGALVCIGHFQFSQRLLTSPEY